MTSTAAPARPRGVLAPEPGIGNGRDVPRCTWSLKGGGPLRETRDYDLAAGDPGVHMPVNLPPTASAIPCVRILRAASVASARRAPA